MSIILKSSVSLLALSLQLLFQVLFLSFKDEPSTSISREISSSSTADDRQWVLDLEFQYFLDHPVCLSVMALFNVALFFSLLTQVPKSDAQSFSKLLTQLSGMPQSIIVTRQEHKSFSQSPSNHLPVHIPILVRCTAQDFGNRSQQG